MGEGGREVVVGGAGWGVAGVRAVAIDEDHKETHLWTPPKNKAKLQSEK